MKKKNITLIVIVSILSLLLISWFFYEISVPKKFSEKNNQDQSKTIEYSCTGFLKECSTSEACEIKCVGIKYNKECYKETVNQTRINVQC